MGFNSTIVVLNDCVHEIRDDPKFGEKVYYAVLKMGGGSDQSVDICSGATVIETHHADYDHVIVVGGNTGQDMGMAAHWTERLDMRKPEDRVKLLKNLAEKEGYSLRKKIIKGN